MLGYLTRRLSLWLCRLVGAVYRGFKNKLIFNALALCAIVGGLWLFDAAVASRPDSAAKTDRNWLTVWNVASIWAFSLLVWWIIRARKQLVISKFEDFTGGAGGAYVPGLGVLVAVELSRLGDLFAGFDVGRAIQATPEKLKPVDVGIQAESPGQFLEKAVSAEASFSLGPFRIPVGIIMGLVGRLVQGPRIVGQIHIDGEERVVTVQMLGSHRDLSWRLSELRRPSEAGNPAWQSAAALAGDLANRIFAELALEGAVRREALAKFVEGLDAYRLSLRTGKQNKLHLHDAERRLIEAVAEDDRFDLAYYNLGVVYNELGQLDAAGAAFARAVQVNNCRWSAFYAWAHNRYQRAIAPDLNPDVALLELFKAIDLCDQADRLAPNTLIGAQVQNLKTLALWRCALLTLDGQYSFAAARNALQAVRTVWRALCWAELGTNGLSPGRLFSRAQSRTLASTCLQDLSQMLFVLVRFMRIHASTHRPKDWILGLSTLPQRKPLKLRSVLLPRRPPKLRSVSPPRQPLKLRPMLLPRQPPKLRSVFPPRQPPKLPSTLLPCHWPRPRDCGGARPGTRPYCKNVCWPAAFGACVRPAH